MFAVTTSEHKTMAAKVEWGVMKEATAQNATMDVSHVKHKDKVLKI